MQGWQRQFKRSGEAETTAMETSTGCRSPAGLCPELAQVGTRDHLALLRDCCGRELFFFSRHPSSPAAYSFSHKSIAVLPFENLGNEKQNSFFADGVQDEILTSLAKVADLKVISRTSVMQYKSDAPRNLREIGQQLGWRTWWKAVCSAPATKCG